MNTRPAPTFSFDVSIAAIVVARYVAALVVAALEHAALVARTLPTAVLLASPARRHVTDALYFLGQHCTERSQAARVTAAIRAMRAAVAADRVGLPAEAVVELDRLGALVARAEAEARGGAAADAIDEYATAAFRTAAFWSVPVIGIIGREWRRPSRARRQLSKATRQDRLAA